VIRASTEDLQRTVYTEQYKEINIILNISVNKTKATGIHGYSNINRNLKI
jgi:hypothetical protein